MEQKCSSERTAYAFRIRSGDLSSADEGRPILPLLLTREAAIIEIFLYIERVAQAANPREATISWEDPEMAEIYPLGFWYFVTRNAAGAAPEIGCQA
jgi:hypothetical protein